MHSVRAGQLIRFSLRSHRAKVGLLITLLRVALNLLLFLTSSNSMQPNNLFLVYPPLLSWFICSSSLLSAIILCHYNLVSELLHHSPFPDLFPVLSIPILSFLLTFLLTLYILWWISFMHNISCIHSICMVAYINVYKE